MEGFIGLKWTVKIPKSSHLKSVNPRFCWTLPGRPFQDSMLGKFPRLCLHLIKFCPSALDLQASSTTERPNCRKIDMARLSRKNQGHHLGSSNMELVIEMQYSLKWELHPAKTIVSWNMRSFSHLHEKRAKFQQLKGHPNPFKTTRT